MPVHSWSFTTWVHVVQKGASLTEGNPQGGNKPVVLDGLQEGCCKGGQEVRGNIWREPGTEASRTCRKTLEGTC